MPDQLILPVILSGGSGTRLWPVSRASFPKQLWPLITDRSLLQETALRAAGPEFAPPLIVCNEEHRFLVAEHMRATGIAGTRIVLEPEGRNSAPAIAAAALLAAEEDPSRVMWIMAADAYVADAEALRAYLMAAVPAARAGRIVTFGMRPSGPETGYGYIEVGAPLADAAGVHDAARFIEKPDPETAARLVGSGLYLWNSGMFVFTAETLLSELQTYAPQVLDCAFRAIADRRADPDFIRLGPAFTDSPTISIDYAVAERTGRAAVVPADLAWSDVGSWAALWEIGAKDPNGNVAFGDVLLENADNCYIRSEGMLTTVVGMSDAVVVVTEDAVLVAKRGQAQGVKTIVERLKAAGRREAVAYRSRSSD